MIIIDIAIILLLLIFAVYAAIMIVFGMGWNKIADADAKEGYVPGVDISLIVPARNEEQHIEALLKDIMGQDYPREKLEVIVVDDFSTDGTRAAVERARSTAIQLLSLEGNPDESSKKNAITEAIKQARGSLIITTDADCRMGSGWLRSVAHYYEKYRPKMIVGPVAYDAGNSFFDSFQSLEFLSLVGSGAGAIGAGLPVMCNGANLAYERQAFEEVHGYDDNQDYASGDDVFLLHKITGRYGNDAVAFLKDREAIVRTGPAVSLREFFEQRVRWASKARGYRDGFSLFTAVTVFLASAGILAGMLTGFYSLRLLGVSLMLLMLKMLVDLPVMIRISHFVRQEDRMVWYPLFQPLYMVYVVVVAIAGSLKKIQWKSRSI
jgi:cellulose synthase/poly-beta-1,6-N-acetylglucosamine synthase-like glycosyltransferase